MKQCYQRVPAERPRFPEPQERSPFSPGLVSALNSDLNHLFSYHHALSWVLSSARPGLLFCPEFISRSDVGSPGVMGVPILNNKHVYLKRRNVPIYLLQSLVLPLPPPQEQSAKGTSDFFFLDLVYICNFCLITAELLSLNLPS